METQKTMNDLNSKDRIDQQKLMFSYLFLDNYVFRSIKRNSASFWLKIA